MENKTTYWKQFRRYILLDAIYLSFFILSTILNLRYYNRHQSIDWISVIITGIAFIGFIFSVVIQAKTLYVMYFGSKVMDEFLKSEEVQFLNKFHPSKLPRFWSKLKQGLLPYELEPIKPFFWDYPVDEQSIEAKRIWRETIMQYIQHRVGLKSCVDKHIKNNEKQ